MLLAISSYCSEKRANYIIPINYIKDTSVTPPALLNNYVKNEKTKILSSGSGMKTYMKLLRVTLLIAGFTLNGYFADLRSILFLYHCP